MKNYVWAVLIFIAVPNLQSGAQEVVQGVSTAPTEEIKKTNQTSLALQGAYSFAVINNRFENKGLYKSGINVGLVYRMTNWFAWEGSFTHHVRHDAVSLDNIQAWNADLNGQLSMKIGESDMYFRTIFGIGYVDWKGYYVGPNLNDNYHYYFGKLLNERFFTGNLGWGFSHMFMKQRLEGFGDFRLRIAGDKRVLFSITDTAFMFGLRYSIVTREKDEDGKTVKANRKSSRNKKSRMYKWLKNR